MGKKNKKVKNNKLPDKKIKSVLKPSKSESLSFDFTYKNWLKTVKIKGEFINKLKDKDEYINYITHCLYNLLPFIQENWSDIKVNSSNSYQFPHCHILIGEKKQLALKIIEMIHEKKIFDEEDDYNLWQFGNKEGLRLIGAHDYQNEVIYPLFIDYHHELYPDRKSVV